MSLGQELSSPPRMTVASPFICVLKAHPIEFAEKPYLFSLWDVPSAHDFSIPSHENPTGRPFVLRVGLVWDVPLAHERSLRLDGDDPIADFRFTYYA